MLLGKHSRHQMKKTTSVNGITVDVDDDVEQPSQIIISDPPRNPSHEFPKTNFAGNGPRFFPRLPPRCPSTMATATAAAGRSGSTSTNRHDHVVDTPHFLRSCCLCKRRLAPGRDIYMYKGDTAFCSQECREEQMKKDERKEKLNNVVSSNKEDLHGHASSTSNSKPSTKTKPALAAA